MREQRDRYDVVVVGGGPAGLSAGLILGRSRRATLVVDEGRPRNEGARATHGLLGHDGIAPGDLAAAGRHELAHYGVDLRMDTPVLDLRADESGVAIELDDGSIRARAVIVATGMCDARPAVPGYDALWGRSAHVCPYCDAWEHRDRRLAALVPGRAGAHMALLLRQWSDDVVLLTDGPHELDDEDRARLSARGIQVDDRPVARFTSADGQLHEIVFSDGGRLARDALFSFSHLELRNATARRAGCRTGTLGELEVDGSQQTSVERIYAAGNCCDPTALVAMAIGQGAGAAVAVNARLTEEDARGARTADSLLRVDAGR